MSLTYVIMLFFGGFTQIILPISPFYHYFNNTFFFFPLFLTISSKFFLSNYSVSAIFRIFFRQYRHIFLFFHISFKKSQTALII